MKIIESPLYNLVLETHNLDIGIFYFFNNIIISEIKEGVHIDLKNSKSFFETTNKFYQDRPFVYISNRINKFSISPLDFAKFSFELNNVKAYSAIVYNSFFDKMNAEIEKRFSHIPFYIAINLEDAFNWSNNIVNDRNRPLTA
ncbi:hypothetical protein [uncultured Lacinutrix sp.]|uniref:hypothetical protein n=1 Tax=uncultured Lacinutrix sp. TaxID=574032 RepID=UPI002609641C|nr:hypothetical protein [uncultured Lacinutrix sp.]